MRRQEREVNYAIRHTERLKASRREDRLSNLGGTLSWFFFELTCQYGMAPERCLYGLVAVVGVCAACYAFVIGIGGGNRLWVTWPKERALKSVGNENKPELASSLFFFPKVHAWLKQRRRARVLSPLFCTVVCLGVGVYYSLLASFAIGWRQLNVGSWISQMQPREYVLRATGWVRFLSGFQAVVSVYLLALWTLTYFGRPFDG